MKTKTLAAYIISAVIMITVTVGAFFLPPVLAQRNSQRQMDVAIQADNVSVLSGYKYKLPNLDKLALFARARSGDNQLMRMDDVREPQGDELDIDGAMAAIPVQIGILQEMGALPGADTELLFREYLQLLAEQEQDNINGSKTKAAVQKATAQFVLYVDMANPTAYVAAWEFDVYLQERRAYCAVEAETGKLMALEMELHEDMFAAPMEPGTAVEAYCQYWDIEYEELQVEPFNPYGYAQAVASGNDHLVIQTQYYEQFFTMLITWRQEKTR